MGTKPKFNIILGLRSKSRTGCLSCKKSKKKCDEKKPTCSLCLKRGRRCIYEDSRIKITNSTKKQSSSLLIPTSSSISGSVMYADPIETIGELVPGDLTELGLVSEFPMQSELQGLSTPVGISLFNIYLDEKGIMFLQYFEEKVSSLLCIDQNSSNYFRKTFLRMSLTEEAISNALACWGGVFLEKDGLSNVLVRNHLRKSVNLVANYPIKDPIRYYTCLCFYQIMIGVQVCLGDVRYWWKMLRNCFDMIEQNGGIQRLLLLFNHSNDVKWLISNFQYHDILLLGAFLRGTRFSTQDYHLNFLNYGVDPYQGCNHELTCLLGEIINAYVTLDKSDAQKVEKLFIHFSQKLKECTPVYYQLNLLNEAAKENYLKLFNIHKFSAELVLLMHFKRLPANSVEIQALVEKSMSTTRSLVDFKLLSCLTFPLFMVGLNVMPLKRLQFMTLLMNVYAEYQVGNLNRVKSLILEVWNQNEDGEIFIDWTEIIREYRWEVCFC